MSNSTQLKTCEAASVIASVVTWNHAGCIADCLDTLLAQTYPAIEVWVSDNASTDDTRAVLQRYASRVRLVFNSENLGFCGGHNAVIAKTRHPLVLLVNPDVHLQPDYVERAVGRMLTDPGIGTVCGLLLQRDAGSPDCLIDGAGLIGERSRRFVLRAHGQPLASTRLQVGEVFGSDGALPLYRREMIEGISVDGCFFDEMFFAHKEDHDVSWRAQLCGWKTVFEPACVAVHPRVFRPGNLRLRKRLAPELKYHAVKNDLLMLAKNEDGSNFLKDFFHIIPRRAGIFFYSLLFERSSLKAYWFVIKNRRAIWRMRRELRQKRKTSAAELRRKFILSPP